MYMNIVCLCNLHFAWCWVRLRLKIYISVYTIVITVMETPPTHDIATSSYQALSPCSPTNLLAGQVQCTCT